MNIVSGHVYRCKSNNLLYKVISIRPYKDERSNGWIDEVVYSPMYECDIKEFGRSKTLFENSFFFYSNGDCNS